jgi:hypothetical protein
MRQTEKAEVCVDQGRATGSSASSRSIARFGRLLRTPCAIIVAKEAQRPDHGLKTLGNPGNVGSGI